MALSLRELAEVCRESTFRSNSPNETFVSKTFCETVASSSPMASKPKDVFAKLALQIKQG